MATIIPPKPKRVRVTGPVETPLKPVQNVIVQFASTDGQHLGPAIAVPTDTERASLEVLANSLKGTSDDPTPFSFYVAIAPPASAPQGTESFKLPIDHSLQQSLREHSHLISTEDILTVLCEPEALFRVREINRCSSSLDGEPFFSVLMREQKFTAGLYRPSSVDIMRIFFAHRPHASDRLRRQRCKDMGSRYRNAQAQSSRSYALGFVC